LYRLNSDDGIGILEVLERQYLPHAYTVCRCSAVQLLNPNPKRGFHRSVTPSKQETRVQKSCPWVCNTYQTGLFLNDHATEHSLYFAIAQQGTRLPHR